MRSSTNRLRLKLLLLAIAPALLVLAVAADCPPATEPTPTPPTNTTTLPLPEPRFDSDVSVEQALLQRRSVRDYTDAPLTLDEISQLLWAAQGITEPTRGFRTSPSAGATYPLETYLVAGTVEAVSAGVYRYDPAENKLMEVRDGDIRAELASAALGQRFIEEAAISIVLSAVYERTTNRYGDRGIRYVHMEAGHAAQNLYLQAVALDLGMVVVGAFHDDQVGNILRLPGEERPLYIIPVGRTD